MSAQKKQNTNKETTPTASQGYQTPLQPTERHTGVESEDESTSSSKSESAANNSAAGSPNQGTEAR